MDGSAFRGLGTAFQILIPLAIIGGIGLVGGTVFGIWWMFHHVSIAVN